MKIKGVEGFMWLEEKDIEALLDLVQFAADGDDFIGEEARAILTRIKTIED